MGNKLYVTQVPTPDFKIMHPDNTVICQVKISCVQLKKQQKAASLAKGKKEKIFFHSYLKHLVKLVLLFNLPI
jgi:large subunit ribosomal protein L25